MGDVGAVVLRDRKHLAQGRHDRRHREPLQQRRQPHQRPDIITRGFIYVKESEDMMRELKEVVLGVLNSFKKTGTNDFSALKGAIKGDLSNYLYKKTKRNPMILPVITQI